MPDAADHHRFMELALREAAQASAHGDVPVGAVVVDSGGRVVAADHNRREERADPTAHAEVLVLAEAAHPAGIVAFAGPHPVCDPGALFDVCGSGGFRSD